MSPSINKKVLRELAEYLTRREVMNYNEIYWHREIQRALKPSIKRLSSRSSKAKEKKSRKAEHVASNSEIRAAVFVRANGACECGCGASLFGLGRGEWDHFFGKGKVASSVESTWAISAACHHRKTNNRPSAEYWLRLFSHHATKHNYVEAIARAGKRLFFVEARSELSSIARDGR